MKVLSLFDGISCARVALDRAGIPVEAYFASEIEERPVQIAQRNYPDTKQLGSVTDVKGELDGVVWHGGGFKFSTKVDLLIGGSPCQDLSIAKSNREGLKGKRSGLFYEYVRILEETKPKWFILENVASMPKEARAEITEVLGVEPIMIDAALVGAQRRKRLFWTNIPNVQLPEDREIYLRDILEENVDEKYYIKDATLAKIYEKLKARKPLPQSMRIHGIDGKSVTLSALGGGGGAKTGLYAVNPDGREQEKARTLRTSGQGSGYGDKHNWDQIAVVTRPRGKNHGSMNTEKAPTLTSSGYEHNNHIIEMLKNGQARVRKLTPTECERLQGLPDGYTEWGHDGEPTSDAQRYKALGNAFNVDVIAHILNHIPR